LYINALSDNRINSEVEVVRLTRNPYRSSPIEEDHRFAIKKNDDVCRVLIDATRYSSV